MGRLKILRMGGGSGAGPLVLGRFFLEEEPGEKASQQCSREAAAPN